jgi:hypothetical protein
VRTTFAENFLSQADENASVLFVSHEQRLAQNEAFFRSVNERIRETADRHGSDPHDYEFLCECSDTACLERVTLSVDEYEAVRADARRFLLAAGHTKAAVERVVKAESDHVVVEKVGVAGEVAEALDPRTA